MSLKPSRAPKWALFLTPILVIAIISKKLNQNPPVSSAQTAPDSPDSALQTRFVDVPWSEAVSAAQSALSAQKTYGRWWKTGQNTIAGALPGQQLREELHAQVPVLFFTDDLVVTLSEQEDGKIRVDCTSKARIGRGDFGENRRHVMQFLRAYDEKLAR